MSILNFIGNTPTVRLQEIEKHFALRSRIFAKAEMMNPGGSIKDRVAYAMITYAERRGFIKRGATIVEPTSGNTGIALSMIGAKLGYRVKIIMPSSASEERERLIRAYGGEVIRTDGTMIECINIARDIEMRGAFMPNQFGNPVCTECHYITTGPEIWRDLNGEIDVFIAGVGTGATVCGIGRLLKERGRVRIIAVEPLESCVLKGGIHSPHGIEGIGAGFIPELYDKAAVDSIETVSTDEAQEMTRILAKKTGILAGVSTGANLAAAVKTGKHSELNIAFPICDRGERYFSSGIF